MFAKALPLIAIAMLAAPLHAQDGDAARLSDESATDQTEAAQGSGAGAQEAPMSAEMLEDANIVSLQGQYDESIWSSGDPLDIMVADLTEIGEIEDVILSADGQMEGLTTDVGGFLGIGQKTVLIPLDDIRLARSPETDEITVITRMSNEELENAEEFSLEE